jgi:NitT/TauT family transport system substrate-binding protein
MRTTDRRAALVAHLVLLAALAALACSGPPSTPPAAPAAAKPADTSAASPTAGAAPAAPAAPTGAPAPAAVRPLSPPVHVKVGSVRLVGEAGVFIALAKGYFTAEGLDVELVPFRTGNEMTPALATGELAFAQLAPDPSIFNAVARGIGLKFVGYSVIISDKDTSGGWIVRQDLLDSGRYRGPEDLKGMVLPIGGPGGIGQVWTERVLARGGLTLDDVQLTTLSFPDQPAAYAGKSIDAGFLVEPFVSVAELQKSATNVVPSGEIYAGVVPFVLSLSPVFEQEQPEVVRRFVTAWLRGQREYYRAYIKGETDRAEYNRILSEYTPIHDEALLLRMATSTIEPNNRMDPRTVDELQDYFVRYGTQQQKVDLSKVLDPSYGEYAVQRLGPMAP